MKKSNPRYLQNKLLLGRCEWCKLPSLGVPAIKAKIDTGAKTSALHAFNLRPSVSGGIAIINFDIHPLQANDTTIISCSEPIIDKREIMSSNGHKELRYVIASLLTVGDVTWEIELTLSNRDPLRYRLLLGRESLVKKALVDPSIDCNQGKLGKKNLLSLYSLCGIDNTL